MPLDILCPFIESFACGVLLFNSLCHSECAVRPEDHSLILFLSNEQHLHKARLWVRLREGNTTSGRKVREHIGLRRSTLNCCNQFPKVKQKTQPKFFV